MKRIPFYVKMLLSLVLLLVPVLAVAGKIQLPQTGQTACYNATGNEIACPNTGQDGDSRAGVAWPNPRFRDNGDGTILDNLSGLIWAKNGNVMKTRDPGFDTDGFIAGDGAVTWQHALAYIKKLNSENYLGHNDWRLPNIIELDSLVHAGQSSQAVWLNLQGFSNVQENYYWSSTTLVYYDWNARIVNMYGGFMDFDSKSSNGYYVWPVRSENSVSTISLPRTGQTTCYDEYSAIDCAGTGQDGELQTGAAWPDPRFRDNGDLTMTDNLTGLVWTRDANAPGPTSCDPGTSKNWQGALNYVKCLNMNNYLGHNDWRLPNRKELRSLVDEQQQQLVDFLNFIGFYDVKFGSYWSSTTYAYNATDAWTVDMYYGAFEYDSKSDYNYNYVWPVRSIPLIQVTPVSLNFGHVPVGSTKDLFLTVKNSGDGTLTGSATTSAPFSIVSGGSYSLLAGQRQVVTIRYQPTAKGAHAGTVVFTGGGGATIPVSGTTKAGLPWLQLLLGD